MQIHRTHLEENIRRIFQSEIICRLVTHHFLPLESRVGKDMGMRGFNNLRTEKAVRWRVNGLVHSRICASIRPFGDERVQGETGASIRMDGRFEAN
ncbi:hypothetical protein AVEN_160277-1 [Araneus ventricosus]|uniref:Uncharacterized protein n=1 Tax=Araneus ventricosus TaxID=182803 RepID=A0A4Y2MRN6_ARAVE|nr:hypothetical protein AVEN_160277-1 [Araneus ventricosus]